MRKTPARGSKQDTSQYLASERVSTQQVSAIDSALPAFWLLTFHKPFSVMTGASSIISLSPQGLLRQWSFVACSFSK
jgi:hypothetical protein